MTAPAAKRELPSDLLQRELRTALARSGLSHRGLEAELGLKNWALKGYLDATAPRVPSVDRAEEIARALGLEFYIGPPRATATTLAAPEAPFVAIEDEGQPDAATVEATTAETDRPDLDRAYRMFRDGLRDIIATLSLFWLLWAGLVLAAIYQ